MTKHSNRKQTQIYLVINTYRAVNGDNNSIHETPALTCECIRGCWSLLIICCWCFCGGIFVMLCILQLAFYFCIMLDFSCLFTVSMVASFSDWSLLFRFSLTFILFFFLKKNVELKWFLIYVLPHIILKIIDYFEHCSCLTKINWLQCFWFRQISL